MLSLSEVECKGSRREYQHEGSVQASQTRSVTNNGDGENQQQWVTDYIVALADGGAGITGPKRPDRTGKGSFRYTHPSHGPKYLHKTHIKTTDNTSHIGQFGVYKTRKELLKDIDFRSRGRVLTHKMKHSTPPTKTIRRNIDEWTYYTKTQNWTWLCSQAEQSLKTVSEMIAKRPLPPLPKQLPHGDPVSFRRPKVLSDFALFKRMEPYVPRIVLEAIDEGVITRSTETLIIDSFQAAVVFVDASGFTALTESCEALKNGSEELGFTVNKLFNMLLKIVHYWGGDVIKFSGDAVTIVWPTDDELLDDENTNYRDGSDSDSLDDRSRHLLRSESRRVMSSEYDSVGKSMRNDALRNKGVAKQTIMDGKTAMQLACQCCLDLHFNIHERIHSDRPELQRDHKFTLHIGVGYGRVTILQVGGIMDRWEYVVAGQPMAQIAIAEPLAQPGETVLSPQAYRVIAGEFGENITDPELFERCFERFEVTHGIGGFAKQLEDHYKLKAIPTTPKKPPQFSSIGREFAREKLQVMERFIPPVILIRLKDNGPFSHFSENEMSSKATQEWVQSMWSLRRVSSVFIGLKGIHVHKNIDQPDDLGRSPKIKGSDLAHELMKVAQLAAYCFEGSVNKMIVDDKGVLILILFGLAPLHHVDDALRACFCAQRVSTTIQDTLERYQTSRLRADGIYDDISDRIPVGIGVATGTVWCGTVGTDFRCEYTALGDPVNLSARLMAKAMTDQKIIENSTTSGGVVLCDKPTKDACDRVFTFISHPPVQLKGKKEKTPMFEPRPYMIDESVTRTTYEDPIRTYPKWRYRKRIMRVLAPRYKFRTPIIGLDDATPDYPVEMPGAVGENKLFRFHPQYPWEITEPWSPSLLNISEAGGVMVIKGGEMEGTTELSETIKSLGEHHLGFNVFSCSNMPMSTDCNIGSVPLLAWRSLCNDIIQRWRVCGGRINRGYQSSTESVMSYVKELLHPAYHWRINELVGIIEGLNVADDYLECSTSDDNGSDMASLSDSSTMPRNIHGSSQDSVYWAEDSMDKEPILKDYEDDNRATGGEKFVEYGGRRRSPMRPIENKKSHEHRLSAGDWRVGNKLRRRQTLVRDNAHSVENSDPVQTMAKTPQTKEKTSAKTDVHPHQAPGTFANSNPNDLLEETEMPHSSKKSKQRSLNRRVHHRRLSQHLFPPNAASFLGGSMNMNSSATMLGDSDECIVDVMESKIRRRQRKIHHYGHENQHQRSKAPLVASVANGYSLHEPTIILWHVRKGSSVYVNVDQDSWESARYLAQIAYDRRRRRIEHDHRALKKWRREHSRHCDYCKGLTQPYLTVESKLVIPEPTKDCRPPPSDFFPPFIFILVCNDDTVSTDTQRTISKWARQCGAYIPLKPMSLIETSAYLGSCLQAPRHRIPPEIIRFVYRITMGIPRYISNTAAKLSQMKALTLYATQNHSPLLKKRVAAKIKELHPKTTNGWRPSLCNGEEENTNEEGQDNGFVTSVTVDRNPELYDFIQDSWRHGSLFRADESNENQMTSEEDSDRVDASSDDLLLDGDDIDRQAAESSDREEQTEEETNHARSEQRLIPVMGTVPTIMCTHKLRTCNILEFNERNINQHIVRSFPVDVRRRGMFLRNGRIVFHDVCKDKEESEDDKLKKRVGELSISEHLKQIMQDLRNEDQIAHSNPRQRTVIPLTVAPDMCNGPSAHCEKDRYFVDISDHHDKIEVVTEPMMDVETQLPNVDRKNMRSRRRRNSVLPGKRSSVASVVPSKVVQVTHDIDHGETPSNSSSSTSPEYRREIKASKSIKLKLVSHLSRRNSLSSNVTIQVEDSVVESPLSSDRDAIQKEVRFSRSDSMSANRRSSKTRARKSFVSPLNKLTKKFSEHHGDLSTMPDIVLNDRGGGDSSDEETLTPFNQSLSKRISVNDPGPPPAHPGTVRRKLTGRNPMLKVRRPHSVVEINGSQEYPLKGVLPSEQLKIPGQYYDDTQSECDGRPRGRIRRVSILIKQGIKGMNMVPLPPADTRSNLKNISETPQPAQSSLRRQSINSDEGRVRFNTSFSSDQVDYDRSISNLSSDHYPMSNPLKGAYIIPKHMYPAAQNSSIDKRLYLNDFDDEEWVVVREDTIHAMNNGAKCPVATPDNSEEVEAKRCMAMTMPPCSSFVSDEVKSPGKARWVVYQRKDLPVPNNNVWATKKKKASGNTGLHKGLCRLDDAYDALILKCPGPENWIDNSVRVQFRPVIAETYTEYPSVNIHVSQMEPEVIKILDNYRIRELARRGRMTDEMKLDSSSTEEDREMYGYPEETDSEVKERKAFFANDKVFHLRLKTLEQIKHDHPQIRFHIESDTFKSLSLPTKSVIDINKVLGEPRRTSTSEWKTAQSNNLLIPTQENDQSANLDDPKMKNHLRQAVNLFAVERGHINSLYIDDLRSRALRTVESLTVEEQEVSMIASAFPTPFSEKELMALVISALPKNGILPEDLKEMLEQHLATLIKQDLIEVVPHAPDEESALLLREYIIKKSRYTRTVQDKGSRKKKQRDDTWSPRVTLDRLLDKDDNQLFKVTEFAKKKSMKKMRQSSVNESQDDFGSNDDDEVYTAKQIQVARRGRKMSTNAMGQGVSFRFKSVAVQYFINIMMLSGKRSRCASLALKILSYRYSSYDRLNEHIAKEIRERLKQAHDIEERKP